jgi:hypothetical protein
MKAILPEVDNAKQTVIDRVVAFEDWEMMPLG